MTSRVLVALRIDAPPQRVFDAFTAETSQWWRANPLFPSTDRSDGRVAIERRLDGLVTESYADGDRFTVGRVLAREPPECADHHESTPRDIPGEEPS